MGYLKAVVRSRFSFACHVKHDTTENFISCSALGYKSRVALILAAQKASIGSKRIIYMDTARAFSSNRMFERGL